MIVQGVGTFFWTLIEAGLIDILYLFLNPTATGKVMPVSVEFQNMQLRTS